MWVHAQLRHSRSSASGSRRVTSVLAAPLVIGSVTTAARASAARSIASRAGMPTRRCSGPLQASRAAASASSRGRDAAATARRSSRGWWCGAPRWVQAVDQAVRGRVGLVVARGERDPGRGAEVLHARGRGRRRGVRRGAGPGRRCGAPSPWRAIDVEHRATVPHARLTPSSGIPRHGHDGAVSSVRAVPETQDMARGRALAPTTPGTPCAGSACGTLLRDAFLRFRYGDGFSHARAFALQLALATVPLVIAGAGLATAVGAESVAAGRRAHRRRRLARVGRPAARRRRRPRAASERPGAGRTARTSDPRARTSASSPSPWASPPRSSP